MGGPQYGGRGQVPAPTYPPYPGYPGQQPPGYPPQPGYPAQAGWGGYGGVTYPPQKRKSNRLPFVLAGVVVVIALVAGGLTFLGRESGPPHPKAWDARVKPLTDFVAKARGLAFKEPVYVDFLTPAQYTKAAGGSGDAGATTAQDAKAQQAALDQQLGQLRALGLVEGKVDLKQAGTDLNDSGTLAYYSPEAERIFVRGTKLTPGLKVTLAHELTHVLQDQHFDLKRLAKLPSTQASAFRAVAEGDARRIEHKYVDSLSEADRKSYEAEDSKASTTALDKLDKTVPPALLALFGAPYDFGTQFVALLDQDGGNTEVNKAFTKPPASDEQIFNPFTYLDDDQPQDVKAPSAPTGTKVEDRDSIGATIWFLLLATRVDPRIALAAADGWGGDQYVEYRKDGKVCVADRVEGDTPKDTDEIVAAAKALPTQLVTVATSGSTAIATFCDPGESVKLGIPNDATKVIGLPVIRSEIAVSALKQGADVTESKCYSSAIVARLTIEQLSASAETPEITKAVDESRKACF